MQQHEIGTSSENGHMNGVEEAPPPPAPEARRGLLGEILVREGLITEGQLSGALRVQREAEPTTPLGQILVRQGVITQRQLNNVLDRYRKKYRLGDILVETETITEFQLQIALDHQKKTGLRLGDALLQLNFVTEEEVNQALCKQFGVTFVDLDRLVLDNSLSLVINREYAERHRVIPISKTDRVLVVAMDDPSDLSVIAELAAATGSRVNVVTSTHAAFRRAFARTYGESAEVGLVRRTEQLGREYEMLRAEHEASKDKLVELRRAHGTLLADREATTRTLAEQRTRNEWNDQALAGLREAHAALRMEYEGARGTLEKLRFEHAENARMLEELRDAYETLTKEHAAITRQTAEGQARNDWNVRALGELRTAQDVLRTGNESLRNELALAQGRSADSESRLMELRASHATLLVNNAAIVREIEAVTSRLKG
jgi:Type II secretion system (T2SS), protein E, N-terminal domain